MRTLKELSNLHGRVALITGGAGHIGRAFAHALAELGASIALVDREYENLEAIAEDLRREYRVKIHSIALDITDERGLRQLPEQVVEELGTLDIIVNNAGFVAKYGLEGWCVPFEEQNIQNWRDAMEVNITAPVFLVQAATPFLKKSPGASVINITSLYSHLGPDMRLYAETPMGNAAGYSASKGALLQMTKWLATVLAPDIRVNCISPGGIWRNQHDLFVKRFEERTPLGRMSTEEDLKGAIAYLASDLSRYVTGHHLIIDGGWAAW